MKNLNLKEMSAVIKKYKVIVQEDDCLHSSERREVFNREFSKHFGISINEFIKGFVPIDLGDTYVYLIGKYRISNEIGLWKVEELEE
jgi:hypothetical protein